MKKANIYSSDGEKKGETELPKVFSTRFNSALINKAVLISQSQERQPYGSNKLAGLRTSAHYHGKRHYRFTMMNKEMSRIPRIHGKVGYMNYRARAAPQAVKGRKAHPPKAEKIWAKIINKKEEKAALMSALSASANLKRVQERGHKTEETPIIFDNDFEAIEKTKQVSLLLNKLLKNEMQRCKKKKVRAGKGKTRGRKYRKKKGPLIIVSKNSSILESAKNIAGVDVVSLDNLKIQDIAPGAQAGRLLLLSEQALQKLEKW